MNNLGSVKIPTGSHGKHRFPYNFPSLTTGNFNEVFPIYYKPLEKGEIDAPKFGVFSRLLTMNLPAFVTGRLRFDGYFVPYKHIWQPYFSFKARTKYFPQGSSLNDYDGYIPNKAVYTTVGNLVQVLSSSLCSTVIDDEVSPFDFIVNTGTVAVPVFIKIKLNATGKVIYRALVNLGLTPNSFWYNDPKEVNLLAALSFIKAYLDYKFPNQYYGNTITARFESLLNFQGSFMDLGYVTLLFNALEWCSYRFYNDSTLDSAFDNPQGANNGVPTTSISINDITNNAQISQVVTNDPSTLSSPNSSSVKPTNGTPIVGDNSNVGQYGVAGVLTQYVVNALSALSNLMKRHQMSARLLDRLLVSFGVKYSNDDVRKSYHLGTKYVEINVDAVENNSNTNLGELAGKGVARSESPVLFDDYTAPDDGILLILCSIVPDASLPIFVDPFNMAVDRDDFYQCEFDKLGVELVTGRVLANPVNGYQAPADFVNSNFGFLPRYYYKVLDRPRLSGDFIVPTAGVDTLNAYHTFRLLDPKEPIAHSFTFINGQYDAVNFQRVFSQEVNDNFMIFIRFYGSSLLEKTPLGDSYDWDDDEFNRRVSVTLANE